MPESSNPRAAEQRRGYRKGMVLGLTLAEVALLLVFVLLLLLATGFARRDKIIDSFHGMVPITAEQLAAMQKSEATLQQVREAFNVPEETPPDDFVRLVKVLAEHTNSADLAASLKEAAEQKKLAQERMDRIAKSIGNDKDSAKKAAETMAAQADQIENQQGQIRQLQKQLQNAGAGRVLPSCWTTPEGRIEFLFDVALTSGGIRVREREQPSRKAERDRLPVAEMKPEVTLEPAQFLALTHEAYQLSLKDNCRFYVVVYDSTGGAEKDLYKGLLGTVEGHFYKINSRDAAPF